MCPCGSEYLHQREVRALWRPEDRDGREYCSAQGKESKERIPAKNCPHRRDSMEILFECEDCGEVKTLSIYQHKGSTHIEWLS